MGDLSAWKPSSGGRILVPGTSAFTRGSTAARQLTEALHAGTSPQKNTGTRAKSPEQVRPLLLTSQRARLMNISLAEQQACASWVQPCQGLARHGLISVVLPTSAEADHLRKDVSCGEAVLG
jgi:hypothetical protein